jgi:transposase InsO family protein
MGIKASPEIKFSLIQEAVQNSSNHLSISLLCKMAGVSRSGFYSWIDCEASRKAKEDKDRRDFDIVLEAFRYRYPKGARGIYMHLLHHNICMNIKKIRRLMDKYGLRCPIRKLNPYRQMAKALKTSNVAPNLVNRNFRQYGPRKILLTDITYLFHKDGCCYLSTILDAYTHEILAYMLSQNLKVDFVIKTVDFLVEKYGSSLDNWVYIHSDQGCHYTSKAFIEKLKDENFIQSMSRKGNCWDNAPQESFFGHMKDEISPYIRSWNTFEDVNDRITDWMNYYNNDRYQSQLRGMAPNEYYHYVITNELPSALAKYLSK